jgi:Xaa-Pro aminopeptidase
VAWTFNLRSSDVEYNPVVISYAVITPRDAEIFLRTEKITSAVRKQFDAAVRLLPYEDAAKAFRELGRRKSKVWVDGGTTNRWVTGLLKGCDLILDRTPVAVMKAKKNAAEIRGMKAAHVRDGVALVRFLHWLKRELPKSKVTELSAEAVLEGFRRRGRLFEGPSFRTIMGYRAHGAIIHYTSDKKTDVRLRNNGIFLIDSGGQYLDGTTDVTRTILLGGRPTKEQRERFTGVLQGHIRLARLRFPAGVRGMRLDTLARTPLWELGLDYNHGTGHGVGSFLSVHEGPQAISPTRCTGVPLEEGNILSNEPGYYKEGAYGIRIENLILVTKDPKLSKKRIPWFRFETITLCPIDTKPVNARLLSAEDKEWLNGYHARVRKILSPYLNQSERAWLARAVRPI